MTRRTCLLKSQPKPLKHWDELNAHLEHDCSVGIAFAGLCIPQATLSETLLGLGLRGLWPNLAAAP